MVKKAKESTGRAIKEEPGEFHKKSSQKETDGQKEESSKQTHQVSMEEKLAQMEKDRLYLCAEIENIKRQNIKERLQLIKYGAEHLARDLLETLDIFKSALDSKVSQKNYRDFVKGMEMTSASLKATLEKHGIKEIDCIDKTFDPKTQEALSSEVTDKYPEGHVIQVFKAPYTYQDKLLRPGQVVVSRAKT